MSLPEIESREEWLKHRKELLGRERELTRQTDRLNADRRRLPMVAVTKDYVFEGPAGPASLLDMFQGHRQLVLQHFMFDPSWDEGCSSCTAGVDEPPAWTGSSCWRTSPVSSAESASSCATATTSSTPTRRSPVAPRCSAAPTPFSTSPRWAGRKNGRSPRAVPPPRARQSPTSRPEPEPDRPAGAGRTAGFSGRAVDLGQGHPLGG